MHIACSSCGCVWDSDEGFYHTADGEIIQPCKLCRCDRSSIYYLNNAEIVRARRKQKYYADLAASRAYDRQRKRLQRASVRSFV
jgi:hypothetical protein